MPRRALEIDHFVLNLYAGFALCQQIGKLPVTSKLAPGVSLFIVAWLIAIAIIYKVQLTSEGVQNEPLLLLLTERITSLLFQGKA